MGRTYTEAEAEDSYAPPDEFVDKFKSSPCFPAM